MRSLGGFVLLSGIGVALFVYLPAPVDRSSSLDELRRAAHACWTVSWRASTTGLWFSRMYASFVLGIRSSNARRLVRWALFSGGRNPAFEAPLAQGSARTQTAP